MNSFFNLGFFPTPLHKLENLSKKCDNYSIYIKRDDQTGLALGGNKTRKLEYLIRDAIDKDCDTIITAGASQSNHCRQTAAAAAKTGLKCHLVLGGYEPKEWTGNLLLDKLFGAEIHWAGEDRKGEGMHKLRGNLIKNGKKPYIIPYGGSNEIGSLGFVNAVKELKHQLDEQKLTMDYIFFASSSGGTHGGLVLGKDLYGLDSEIVGIEIDKSELYGMSLKENIVAILNKTADLLKMKKRYEEKDLKLDDRFCSAGYGVLTNNETNAIKLLAQQEGILLDPVYTARAFHGMMYYIENKKINPGSNILFWHTGGTPSNFMYANDLIN